MRWRDQNDKYGKKLLAYFEARWSTSGINSLVSKILYSELVVQYQGLVLWNLLTTGNRRRWNGDIWGFISWFFLTATDLVGYENQKINCQLDIDWLWHKNFIRAIPLVLKIQGNRYYKGCLHVELRKAQCILNIDIIHCILVIGHWQSIFWSKDFLRKTHIQKNLVFKTYIQGVTADFVSKILKILHTFVFLANSWNIEQ